MKMIAKKLTVILLILTLAVTFTPLLGQTAYAENDTDSSKIVSEKPLNNDQNIGDQSNDASQESTVKKSLSECKVTIPEESVLYTGKTIRPKVTVKDGSNKLVKGRDYSVSYRKNRKIGTARVIVKGKGNYKGKVTKKFKIVKYFKLKKSKYSKYIQGKVTKGQLKTILLFVMLYNNDRQAINKKKISKVGKETVYHWTCEELFRSLESFHESWGDDSQTKVRFTIKEANQLLSSFTSFRYKKGMSYVDTDMDFKLWTNDKYVNLRFLPGNYWTQGTWVKIISAKRYAKKIEVVFKYGGVSDEYGKHISDKYVAVLKKQSNGKYKLVKINLKDTYGMKKVPKSKYKKLIKGKLTKKQLRNVINAVMIACSGKKMSKNQIRNTGYIKKRKWYIYVHACAFGKNSHNGIKIKTANRILSSFTTFRYKKNRLYKTKDPDYYAKTSSKRVSLYMPATGIGGYVTIKAARYNSRKMVILYTLSYDTPLGYYKAILKKDKSKKFKLVRIEETIPHK